MLVFSFSTYQTPRIFHHLVMPQLPEHTVWQKTNTYIKISHGYTLVTDFCLYYFVNSSLRRRISGAIR